MIVKVTNELYFSDHSDAKLASESSQFDWIITVAEHSPFHGDIIFRLKDGDRDLETPLVGYEAQKQMELFKQAVELLGRLDAAFPDARILVHCLGNNPLILDGLRFKHISEAENTISSFGIIDKILQRYQRHYNGDVIKLKIKTLRDPFFITPEHKILVWRKRINLHGWQYLKDEPEWVEAKDITSHDFLVIPKIKYEWKKSKYSLDMLYFFGIYTAEGYSNHGNYPSRQYIEVGMTNKTIIEKISCLFKNSKIYEEERKGKRLYRLRIKDADLRDFLENNFGRYARNKKIPDFILQSTIEEKRAFLEGLLDGDGCKRINRRILITSSKNLAYDVYSLTLTMDKLSYITYQERHTKYIGYEWISKTYNVEIPEKPRYYKDMGTCFIVPVINKTIEQYDGVVHNLETTNHDYAIPFVVHNCNAGISRSSSVCIGYLMRYQDISYDEAYNRIKALKPIINPHPFFVDILQNDDYFKSDDW